MEGKLIKLEESKYTLVYKEGNIAWENNPAFDGKLSLKNCQAIENGYDLDELAREACNITDPLRLDSQKYKQDPYFKIGFNKGFQKALELVEHRLSKETEWQVEIVMDICGDKVYAVPEPALDENGCLILKRK